MSGLPKVPAQCCFTICAANKNIERKAPWWIYRGSNPGIVDYEPSPLTAEVQIRIAGLSRLSAVNHDKERNGNGSLPWRAGPESNRQSPMCYGCACRKHLPPILRAGLVFPGTPQIPALIALQIRPQGGIEPHYVTGVSCLISAWPPRPRHRAAAYLRVPSVRLSSVTAFRFATAFSPCGGCRSLPAVKLPLLCLL